jgi:hypothetical protein
MCRSSSTRTILAAALVLGLPPGARAQTSLTILSQLQTAVPQPLDQAQAITRLSEARLTLDTLPAATGATAGALGDLRRDFESLQSMYVAQNPATGTPAAAGSRRGVGAADSSAGRPTGAVGTAGTHAVRSVGTAGSTGSVTSADWRAQYAVVNADIAALMTAPTANAGVGSLRVALQELRTRLERFYTSTAGPTPTPVASANPPSPPSPSTVTARPLEVPAPSQTNAEATMLLQRMQQLLSHQESDDGRSLKSAGKVTMNRADVDEILAEIRDLTLMLQR